MSAWKDLERRICRLLGGQRRGPTGTACSDCVDTPFAVEVKRSRRRVPEGRWIAQAAQHGRRERKPWLLVVAGHRDRDPLAVLPLSVLLELTRAAGWTPEAEEPQP